MPDRGAPLLLELAHYRCIAGAQLLVFRGSSLFGRPLIACILAVASLKRVKQDGQGCRFSEGTEVPVACQERYAGIETTLSNQRIT